MPLPNIEESGYIHELLVSKTDFAVATFTGGDRFIGADGAVVAAATSAPLIDLRRYRQVQLWVHLPGLNAGPYVQWSMENAPTDTQSVSFFSNSINTASGGATSTEPTVCIMMGADGPGWTSLSGGVITSTVTVGTPIVPPYTRLKFWNSAAITTLTTAGAGLWLYGIR